MDFDQNENGDSCGLEINDQVIWLHGNGSDEWKGNGNWYQNDYNGGGYFETLEKKEYKLPSFSKVKWDQFGSSLNFMNGKGFSSNSMFQSGGYYQRDALSNLIRFVEEPDTTLKEEKSKKRSRSKASKSASFNSKSPYKNTVKFFVF
jgi:hypothetical protein